MFSTSASAQETIPAASASPKLDSAAMARALELAFGAPPDPQAPATAKPNREADRRCPGCPIRRLFRPYVESIWLNFMYNGINHLSGHPTADIGARSIWRNLRAGFEWDENPWTVNQIGHPYQGSNYFTSGRAHGLTFYESTAVAAFGSSTWEFLFENNRASLNDLVNTTVGGIAVGEVLYRLGWLVRHPERSGKGRNEMMALAIDPIGGLARMTSGDSKRVALKPADMIPVSVKTRGGVGVMWQGKTVEDAEGSARPFFNIDMDYGGVRTGRSKIPFGAFGLELIVGGGSPVSQFNIRGRHFGTPFGKDGKAQFSVFQTFDYMKNDAFSFGGQGVEVEVATKHSLSSKTSLFMAATGGSTFLGAVDTLIRADSGVFEDPELLERRPYDYGPTLRFGGVLELQHADTTIVRLMYQGYQLNVVDGTRAFHVLQRGQLDIRIPIVRQFSLGMAAEFFFRKAYYWPDGNRTAETSQLRLFAAWSPKTASPQPLAAAPPAVVSRAVPATAETTVQVGGPAAPQQPTPSFVPSKFWMVGGGGFTMARAGCAKCDRSGVFTNSKGLFFDVGGRVSTRVDFGVEFMAVSARIETEKPIRTTFILGIGQFRPWLDRGLYVRAGIGVGFAGNGIYSPIGWKLQPPYSTNALGVTYGLGWVFMRERRWGVQANFQHHIAALGELTTESGKTVKNVVGNYWTSGVAIVYRKPR
jgi:hypothetical protein